MAGKTDKRDKKTGPGLIGKGYLFLYNAIQLGGWSYLLSQVVRHYINGGDISNLWDEVKTSVIIFQNAALLEVVHVGLGLVKSNLLVTAMQVASRVMVVCGVLLATPTARFSTGLPLLLLAWCFAEITRYGFYASNIFSSVPYFIVWCRYTFFYVLYPVGVTGELLCFYAAQRYVAQHKLWSFELPNSLNFTFSYLYLLRAIMASYIPLFPQMYLHMVSQRKKIIGGGAAKKKS